MSKLLNNYNPENLQKYLEDVVSVTCKGVLPTSFKFNIILSYITSDYMIFTFNYIYKKYRDVSRCIKIVNNKNIIIYQNRYKIFHALRYALCETYEGVNGSYNFLFPIKDENLIIYASKEEINSKPVSLSLIIHYLKLKISYIDILPKELQMIVIDNVSVPYLKVYISITTKNILDLDYKSLMKVYHQKVFSDIDQLMVEYPNLSTSYTWKDIYIFFRYNINDLYLSIKEPEITKADLLSSFVDKCAILKKDISISEFTLYSIFCSFRMKFLYPEFYIKLLSFHKYWSSDFTDFALTFNSLYKISHEEPTLGFITALANDFPKFNIGSRRPFPSNNDCRSYLNSDSCQSRIGHICSSSMLLWYIINNKHIDWSDTDTFYGCHYEILESLAKSRICFDLWIVKITDRYLAYLIRTIRTNLGDVTRNYLMTLYKLTTGHTFELLKAEVIKRGMIV